MSARCEYCTRKLGKSELVEGIRYGTVDQWTGMFVPARDSAATVICSKCSELLLKLIYTKLGRTTHNIKLTYSR